jgi:murein DD-endopeptidase MepM/ murein hydrolase activator NlpD
MQIADANQIQNINILSVGQVLIIPVVQPTLVGPSFKIIPDSELVAGPATVSFDIADFTYSKNGYLVRYQEEVEGQMLTGFQIVQRIATDYSVNPRLLLAMIEYQSGWVTSTNPRNDTLKYPLGLRDSFRDGLYKQLAWAANNLNRGYYLWRVNAVASWSLTDGTIVPVNPTINAGTAAIQYFFSLLYDHKIWEKSISEEGFFAVYDNLFGYPFDYAVEPVIPAGLLQPRFQLPFENGVTWAFTGGPHGGWGDGSAWAALDFAPFVDAVGCITSDFWVVAMADGLIIRAENGAVVQDLDGDNHEQTGWTILYMHIETRDRVQAGVYLHAGERIGHPSCEGGVSNGTHVHIARRYNGEWIPADQDLPFVLDGWVSSGTGKEYDGFLQKGSTTLEAWDRNIPANAIER